ncbi:CBO0543 family protein [Paenibacillus aurantiacus]|uniref:CBO0543 family protein n=1 Tax=Paenibacillus aurantiacus TaxID=1936118 RepID=A0ABV5KL31_9BACL
MIAMNVERWLLLSVWVVCLPALFFGIAKERRREMVFAFLLNQTYTWTMSLVLVESGAAANPVREFVRASGSNFSFNFILYPAVAVFYALYVPKGLWRNAVQLAAYLAGLALFTWVVSTYTRLIDFRNMGWLLRVLVYGSGLVSARIGYMWFFGRGVFGAKEVADGASLARYDSSDGV